MKKTVRVGIIGAGWPGQQHGRAVRATSGAVLQALAEPNEERAAEFLQAYEPKTVYSDFDDLLGDAAVDAVVICLPNHLHFPATLAALRAGKHVLCEKPPTLNGAEMRVLQEEAEKRGLLYFFSRQFRFTPAMRRARELIAADELGKIYFAEAVWVRSRGIPLGIGGWFTEKTALRRRRAHRYRHSRARFGLVFDGNAAADLGQCIGLSELQASRACAGLRRGGRGFRLHPLR